MVLGYFRTLTERFYFILPFDFTECERPSQGGNEVRWRPGQETRSFWSQCSALKKALVTLLGIFGAPPVIRHPGNFAPHSLPPWLFQIPHVVSGQYVHCDSLPAHFSPPHASSTNKKPKCIFTCGFRVAKATVRVIFTARARAPPPARPTPAVPVCRQAHSTSESSSSPTTRRPTSTS